MESERLDKFIANQKNLPRSECRRLITRGKVTVNGKTVRVADTRIDPRDCTVTLNGEEISYNKYLYIMLNKPKGVLSAASDKSRTTVVDLVPPELSRKNLFPVGRLDRDTTGLLLITDDGEFAHRVISPKSNIEKVYEVLLDGEVTEENVDSFKNGITLHDGTPCLPAKLERLEDNPNFAVVTVMEGKYHQIKRMFGTLDLGVVELHRKSIGGIELDPILAEGECRLLTDTEIATLYKGYSKNQQ